MEVVSCAVRFSSFWDGDWRKLGMVVKAEYMSSILGNWMSFFAGGGIIIIVLLLLLSLLL